MTILPEAQQHPDAVFDHTVAAALPPLRHRWPQLGRKLVQLEQAGIDAAHHVGLPPLTEREKEAQRADFRATILTQVHREEGTYSRDMRYLAFLLLKQGRAGLIVGNPYTFNIHGIRQELPYTGLEGYYAGVDKTPERPGLTPEAIIQEEATIGMHLLKTLKQQAIEANCWIDFIHLKQALAWKDQSVEVIRTIQLLWSTVIRRLHVRLYHCPEFEPTLTEQIEEESHLLNSPYGTTTEAWQFRQSVQRLQKRLQREYNALRHDEKEQERQERSRRAWIRNNRMEAFHRFHEETYELLLPSHEDQYELDVQENPCMDAAITETIRLPAIPGRQTYPSTSVHLTPEQLEGYLFLARLGEIGGDPLARGVLVTSLW